MRILFGLTALIVSSMILAAASSGSFQNSHDNVHLTLFECSRCHVGTPSQTDTLETAPLIKPSPALCLDCHV